MEKYQDAQNLQRWWCYSTKSFNLGWYSDFILLYIRQMGGLPFLDHSARHYSCLHLAPPLPPESARHRNHGPAYQPRGQTPGQYLHSTKRDLSITIISSNYRMKSWLSNISLNYQNNSVFSAFICLNTVNIQNVLHTFLRSWNVKMQVRNLKLYVIYT